MSVDNNISRERHDEHCLVRAELVGFNQPLGVPKEAIHRSLVRSVISSIETAFAGRTCIQGGSRLIHDCIFLPAANDQEGVVISMIERFHKSALPFRQRETRESERARGEGERERERGARILYRTLSITKPLFHTHCLTVMLLSKLHICPTWEKRKLAFTHSGRCMYHCTWAGKSKAQIARSIARTQPGSDSIVLLLPTI